MAQCETALKYPFDHTILEFDQLCVQLQFNSESNLMRQVTTESKHTSQWEQIYNQGVAIEQKKSMV